MDPHSTVEDPPGQTNNRLYNFLGGVIAVLTLVLPLYITSHYSSLSAVTNTTLSSPPSGPVQR
jgi:hypothetical protein